MTTCNPHHVVDGHVISPTHRPDDKKLTSAEVVPHFIRFSTVNHIDDYVMTVLNARSNLAPDLVSIVTS
jgi:hypothetical protein